MSIKKKKILITGAAGYIGSHIINFLSQLDYEIHSLDRNKVKFNLKKKYIIDLENNNKIKSKIHYDCIVHLASYTLPRESFSDVNKYIYGNLKMTHNLIKQFPNFSKFIFFSTANLYSPSRKVTENSKITVQSPYAESKLINEKFLYHLSKSNDYNIAIFRLFNAAGSDIFNNFEYHLKEKNNLLIPSLYKSYCKNSEFKINGTKHKTKDGTCIRDFIHVYDIANAVNFFIKNKKSKSYNIYNLGSSKGHSVKNVIKKFENLTNNKLKIKNLGNQKGDPSVIVSDCSKIRNDLKWKPKYSSLLTILKSSINSFKL